MQSFKEISYQNYIELRFNQKNLQDAEQHEALLKYKRNAQLLAEIFSFEKKPANNYKAEPVITEDHLREMQSEVEREKMEGEKRIQEIQQKSKNYCQIFKKIKEIKNESQRNALVEELKATDLYDGRHPYFAQGSPFFLNSTDEQVLEVTSSAQLPDEATLTIKQIK